MNRPDYRSSYLAFRAFIECTGKEASRFVGASGVSELSEGTRCYTREGCEPGPLPFLLGVLGRVHRARRPKHLAASAGRPAQDAAIPHTATPGASLVLSRTGMSTKVLYYFVRYRADNGTDREYRTPLWTSAALAACRLGRSPAGRLRPRDVRDRPSWTASASFPLPGVPPLGPHTTVPGPTSCSVSETLRRNLRTTSRPPALRLRTCGPSV